MPASIVQIDSAVRPDGRRINVREALKACAVDVGFAALGVHTGEKCLVGLGEVEQTIVQDRGRDVRCAAALGPEDFIGTGDISLGIQRDGHQGVAFVAGHAVNGVAFDDRARDSVAGEAGTFPDHLAGVQIVAANFAGSSGDDLCFAAVRNDGWCGPCVFFVAFSLPECLAVFGVENLDGGLSGVVADNDEFALVDHRRAAFAEAGAHFDFSEAALPKFVSIEI